MKKILGFLLVISIIFNFSTLTVKATPTSDADTDVVFSTTPSKDDLKLVEPVNQNVKAWIKDANGNIQFVNPKFSPKIRNGNIIQPNYVEGRLVYTFLRYEDNVSKSNPYQHFVSSVSIKNTTNDPITLKYYQQKTTTNTWSVTGNIEVEAQFSVQVLAKLKAKFGASVTKSHTTYSSDSVEFTMNVPVGKTGKISKYYAGKFTGGYGVWKVQDVIGGYEPWTYYEEVGAWGIEPNEVNYQATTY